MTPMTSFLPGESARTAGTAVAAAARVAPWRRNWRRFMGGVPWGEGGGDGSLTNTDGVGNHQPLFRRDRRERSAGALPAVAAKRGARMSFRPPPGYSDP